MEALQRSSSDEEEVTETKLEAGHVTEEADYMTSSWGEAEETDTSDEEVKVVRPRYHFLLSMYILCAAFLARKFAIRSGTSPWSGTMIILT